MNNQVAGHQTEGYVINTPVYEGPLDLLLNLIERAELDITRVSLALVTDQYLAYLQDLQNHDPAEVSAFLVIAAKLVQIKSEALLPHPPAREEGEEDPGDALAKQLIAYKRVKQASQWLGHREETGLRTYLRLAAPPKVEEKLDMTGVTIEDLVAAARRIFLPDPDRPYLSTVVSIPIITIQNKIRSILQTIQKQGWVSFGAMLGRNHTRVEIVVTFLAMLELIKRHILAAQQPELFADISLTPLGGVNELSEIDLDITD